MATKSIGPAISVIRREYGATVLVARSILLLLIGTLAACSMLLAPPPVTQEQKASFAESVRRSNWTGGIAALELAWEKSYEDYWGSDRGSVSLTTPDEIASVLERLRHESGQSSALIYLRPSAEHLEILALIPGHDPVYRQVSDAAEQRLMPVVRELSSAIAAPRSPAPDNTDYLKSAQQLYAWLVKPIETELAAANVDVLLFCAGPGLRTLPFAALHDGSRFLIERYNPVRIPAFNLIKARFRSRHKAQPVAAFGASIFPEHSELQGVPDLPGALVEVNAVANSPRDRRFLNEAFTMTSLEQTLAARRHAIVHIATHATFNPGDPTNSYIVLPREQLDLSRLVRLDWEGSGVDLLVLSACQTAIGDKDAELGFAGLAFQTGVDSVIASLWSVHDIGTLALMTELHQQLRQDAGTKAKALQRAQLALLTNTVQLAGGSLQGISGTGSIPVSEITMANSLSFRHPYFWAAFTLVGSPW